MGAPVVHFEIGGKDAPALAKFYCDLLGWTSGAYGPAQMFDTGTKIGIMGHASALGHEPHNYCVVYAGVDDLPAAIAKAKALGGSQVIPPTKVPGMGQFAWIKDPQGNLFGLWKSVEG